MRHPVRIKLTNNGMLAKLVNYYTMRGAQIHYSMDRP